MDTDISLVDDTLYPDPDSETPPPIRRVINGYAMYSQDRVPNIDLSPMIHGHYQSIQGRQGDLADKYIIQNSVPIRNTHRFIDCEGFRECKVCHGDTSISFLRDGMCNFCYERDNRIKDR
jgi:hypothetical protein